MAYASYIPKVVRNREAAGVMSEQTIRRQPKAGKKPTARERRAWVRYPSAQDGACYTPASEWGHFWKASIRDISRGGIGLVLDEPFSVDTVVAVELKSECGEAVRVLTARVRHITAAEDGRWMVGCEFLRPLDDDNLASLLV
jgi:PilZ domain